MSPSRAMTIGRNPAPTTTDWTALADRLRRCARTLVGLARHDLADDLVQDTLARLLSHDSSNPVPSYAYARSTLVRLYMDHERGARRRAARALRWAVVRSTHTNADAPTDPRLRAAIDRLSPLQRTVVVLRLIEELPTDAVAESLGASPRVVRATLHTARTRLRAALRATEDPS